MKIILSNNNFPNFEQLGYRKSFITTKDTGIIDDTLATMVTNRNNFCDAYFPSDITKVSNKMIVNNLGEINRQVTLAPRDFPTDMYPNSFTFWNNVNYAKIIYDDGLIEYNYIVSKKQLNSSINQWEMYLQVDIWNTYWPDVYDTIIRNNNISIDMKRWHEDRFDKDGNFKFLTTQKTAFWNREHFDEQFQDYFTTKQGDIYTPYTDVDRTKISNPEVSQFYNRQDGTNIFGNNGFPYYLFTGNGLKTKTPYSIDMPSWYGLPNTMYIMPWLNPDYFTISFSSSSTKATKKGTYYDKWIPYKGNFYVNVYPTLEQTKPISYLQTLNFAPKPMLLPANSNWDFKTISYQELRSNSSTPQDYDQITPQLTDGIDGGIALRKNTKQPDITPPTITNDNSWLNALCDERVYIDINFKPNLTTHSVLENRNVNLDPNVINTTQIEYGYIKGQKLNIIPKWYYYQNLTHLDENNLYLKGYQFLQPHISMLQQWPVHGLYKNINLNSINVGITSQFSPNLQLQNNSMQNYLVRNKSSMIAGLATNFAGSLPVIGQIVSAGKSAVTSFNQGRNDASTANTQTRENFQNFYSNFKQGNLSYGGYRELNQPTYHNTLTSGLKASTNAVKNSFVGNGLSTAYGLTNLFGGLDYIAKMSDLARTPNSVMDISSEQTFVMLNSTKPYVKVNELSDESKNQIYVYHQNVGYALNDKVWINGNLGQPHILKSFATRIFYNFYEFPQLKLLLMNSSINNVYQNYFQHMFDTGIQLVHNANVLGNEFNLPNTTQYFENWEMNIINQLIGAGTVIEDEDIEVLNTDGTFDVTERIINIENTDGKLDITLTQN